MKVSEQALCECRAAISIASPIPINLGALDHLIETVRSSFEHVLDEQPRGAETWQQDRPMMLLQGSAIGSLAAVMTKLGNLDAKEVSLEPLMAAFAVVKAGCDVMTEAAGNVKTLTKYCSLVPPTQGPVRDMWMQILRRTKS